MVRTSAKKRAQDEVIQSNKIQKYCKAEASPDAQIPAIFASEGSSDPNKLKEVLVPELERFLDDLRKDDEICPETLAEETVPDTQIQGPPGKPQINLIQMMDSIKSGTSPNFAELVLGKSIGSENVMDCCSELKEQISAATAEADHKKLGKRDQNIKSSLDEFIATGDWDSRGRLATMFRKTDLQTSIKDMTTAQAREFRLSWAKDLKSKIVEKKNQLKSWSRIDTTTWKYRPFGRLVLDFGGWTDPAAIQGATTGAMQCLMMGDPFVKEHPQTKMMLFAIADIEWSETFEQSWKETTDYYSNVDPAIAGAPESEKEGGETKVIKDQLNGGKTKNDKPPTVADPKDLAIKKEAAELWSKGIKLKNQFTITMNRAVEILEEIKRDGKYDWARDSTKGRSLLENDLRHVRSCINSWQRDFCMSTDLPKFKKLYDQATVTVEITNFLKSEPKIGKLTRTCDAIVNATASLDL
jgi:hypothetical protein